MPERLTDGITELENAHYEARRAEGQLEHERDMKRRSLLEAEASRIDRELAAEYGGRLGALKSARVSAFEAEQAAKESAALAGAGAPFPVGTRLQKWGKKNRWDSRIQSLDEFGTLEAVTRTTTFPANTASYSRPGVGTYIVRLEKKDGSKSSRFVVFNSWRSGEWRPA